MRLEPPEPFRIPVSTFDEVFGMRGRVGTTGSRATPTRHGPLGTAIFLLDRLGERRDKETIGLTEASP